ncbi:hypothetical protein OE88DRAFT_1653418 [Heliocybe sulcata]|uniref:Zn(2)-C6 fungal-type domain-containing protein n=1 Tax=Heliocybe sulcata TaxID=5364 RepID=A0A5C3NEI5_9AGAM|nr:hypothetical protein OE88DRAFT_1653418 [Heliocybe sulcata]
MRESLDPPGSQQRSSSVQRTNSRAPPRKKACQNCTTAKTRCDLQRPTCLRCHTRGITCHYSVPPPDMDHQHRDSRSNGPLDYSSHAVSAERSSITDTFPTSPAACAFPSSSSSPSLFSDSNTGSSGLFYRHEEIEASPYPPNPELPSQTPSTEESHHVILAPANLSFLDMELVSSIDSSRIRNRWLDQILASADQKPKHISPLAVNYISRVFKTYPKMMLHPGGLPPIIHPMQAEGSEIPVPLANCLSLVRMWENRARGSDGITTQTIKWEMERLFREHSTYRQTDLLAAFQAYLIYAIMLFFSSSPPGKSLIDRTIMISLQEFASHISQTGLVCSAELSHTRPRWESWIIASAKRRTLYTMYILDNVFCTLNQIPCHLAQELAMLSAPESKALWEARDRELWEREYDVLLAAWKGGSLRIGELWASEERSTPGQQERIQRWLEGVDEYGMMYFSFSVMIHGI